jgi:hypothetical protein
MPSGDQPVEGDDVPSDLSRWQRFTGSVSNFALKPAVAAESATGNNPGGKDGPTTIPEIEAAIKRADDKERLIGLLAAPVAAGIGLITMSALIDNDPAAFYSNGQVNPHHVNPHTFVEFGLIAIGLAVIMLVAAWFRKRLFIGIASALYGLSLFNLHYWGFGVPFILIGSFYMVRAYRLSEKLKRAKAGDASGFGTTGAPPPQSKRYTPPRATTRRAAPKPKPGKGIEAG